MPVCMDRRRQGSGSGHHQAQASKGVADGLLFGRRQLFNHPDQSHVDCGHSHEHRERILQQTLQDSLRLKAIEGLDQSSAVQSTADHVNDAVNMVQRQKQRDAIRGLPIPRLHQRFDLRLNAGVSRHDAFGTAGRSAGVQNHGSPISADRGQRCRVSDEVCGRITGRIGTAQQANSARFAEWSEPVQQMCGRQHC
ncbi:hypothetical protein LBMAG46_35010 [Planctomycetia bacterium]|nr:hypothetical protein LBMAG46_35010 [Planctomycetia bacterium]